MSLPNVNLCIIIYDYSDGFYEGIGIRSTGVHLGNFVLIVFGLVHENFPQLSNGRSYNLIDIW